MALEVRRIVTGHDSQGKAVVATDERQRPFAVATRCNTVAFMSPQPVCPRRATGGNLSPAVREARENRWVIAVFAVISLPMLFWRPGATARRPVSWTATPSAGSVSRCSRWAAPYACGPYSCSATGSADWWRSSPGTPGSAREPEIRNPRCHFGHQPIVVMVRRLAAGGRWIRTLRSAL